MEKIKIKVQVTVKGNIDKIWKLWTSPNDIMQWNNASDDWHTTKAEIQLIEGGKFLYRMEAKDESVGFDFAGVYDTIIANKLIAYTLEDSRKVGIHFSSKENETTIIQTFEAETENTLELQQFGWQAILNNFKKYAETI